MRKPPGALDLALYRDIGALIAKSRQGRGLTQAGLAQRCSMSRGSIANIELARQHVPVHTLYKLAIALDIHPHSLLPSRRKIAAPSRGFVRRTLHRWFPGTRAGEGE